MGCVFVAENGEDFLGEHFVFGSAGVFVFVDVDGDLWGCDLWWSGCGCRNEGRVREGVLGVGSGLSGSLCFLRINEMVGGERGGEKCSEETGFISSGEFDGGGGWEACFENLGFEVGVECCFVNDCG